MFFSLFGRFSSLLEISYTYFMENPVTRALFLHFVLFRTEKLLRTQEPVTLPKNQSVLYQSGLFSDETVLNILPMKCFTV